MGIIPNSIKMKNSPFIYGNTVSGAAFTNREIEVLKLKSNLINGINTSIISPRRWGKSSLVEKVCKEINREHPENKISIEAVVKQIAKADIAGGAVGGVSAWWLNAVPVYGQVSYGAFIGGGALAASGHEAVKSFLDWLWP